MPAVSEEVLKAAASAVASTAAEEAVEGIVNLVARPASGRELSPP
jgi:hypothetical protein